MAASPFPLLSPTHTAPQDHTPDYDSYCMLGEAFMQIQEPEKAVRAFESALEFSPKDVDLITRVRACGGSSSSRSS